MKKVLLTYFLIFAFGFLAKAQDTIEDLPFDSKFEKEFWEAGQSNPYLLFRAVQSEKSPSDEKWTNLISELDQKFE
ncbi:MAG: hypothetical protein ABJC55_02855, partial [Algoriphagus sp.]